LSTYTLHHGDALEVMRAMPDASVDAVITDPPYFRAVAEKWDRCWKDRGHFLEWFALLVEQWQRLLKPNGSLFTFASPLMAAHVQVEIDRRFKVLNHIVWDKGVRRSGIMRKTDLRQWFDHSERAIFAEHEGANSMALGESGYAAQCEKTRQHVYKPLVDYMRGEWLKLEEPFGNANKAIGTCTMAGHYFKQSQFTFPTAANYAKLRAYAVARGVEAFGAQYEDLRSQYEDLRSQYEDLRRPFKTTDSQQFRGIWKFQFLAGVNKIHPTQKPLPLMLHVVAHITLPGAVILDPFMGSGSTGEAALRLGREFIGVEVDAGFYAGAERRLATISPDLFEATK